MQNIMRTKQQNKPYVVCTLLGLLCCLVMSPAAAQSLVFSQYYFSPASLNPALAGLEKDLFLGVNYRSQWRNLQLPHNASLFSLTYPLFMAKPKQYHAGGLAFSVSDESTGNPGLYRSVRAHLSAAYNLRLDYQSKNIIAMGIQGGFVQSKLDGNNLQWGSQYNQLTGYDPGITPSLGQFNSQTTYPAFSAGLVWHHTAKTSYYNNGKYRGFIGISLANLNRPNTSLFTAYTSRAPLIYRVQGGIDYQIRNLQIAHNALWISSNNAYHFNFGTYVISPVTSLLNLNANTLKLLLGAWYRFQDAFVLSTGLQAKRINIALSYDLNKVSMGSNTLSGGAYEVSVSYRIPRKIKNKQYGIPLM